MSAVSGIDIPEDEYSEDAGLGKKTTAQLVQERKIDDVASSNELSSESMTAQTANSLEQAAKALGGLSKK